MSHTPRRRSHQPRKQQCDKYGGGGGGVVATIRNRGRIDIVSMDWKMEVTPLERDAVICLTECPSNQNKFLEVGGSAVTSNINIDDMIPPPLITGSKKHHTSHTPEDD
jgi:hypothetical protein